MPKEGRINLTCGYPLAEYDVSTCHPRSMLKLFTNASERTKYAEMLSGDIYTIIGLEMGKEVRKLVKDDFQRVVNISHKKPDWMANQYVFQFYYEHFPVFALEVLFSRKDLAQCLQNLEAQLMVQKLGGCCKNNGLFWVPMHDGFIARIDQGNIIKERASKIIQDEVGFIPRITMAPLNSILIPSISVGL